MREGTVFHPAPQGTPEWHAARVGVCTASTFAQAVSVTTRKSGERQAGDPSAESDELAAILAIERVTGEPYRNMVSTYATAEGHRQEPEARMAYELATGRLVDEAGLLTTEDRRFGYSTDGMVIGEPGLVEIKSLVSAARVAAFITARDRMQFVAEFMDQCNGGMWLTGAQWIDLVVWIPQLRCVGKHLNIIRIERDDNAIFTLERNLLRFDKRVSNIVAALRAETKEEQQ